MDHILQTQGMSSWSETRISLEQFRKISQEHLMQIVQTQHSLQGASNPFRGQGDIRPIHCKLALNSLDEMNGSIEKTLSLFYETSHLPLVIMAMRFQTLHILHRIETQTSQLKELLGSLRTTCITPSRQVQKQRSTIYDLFDTLLQSLTEFSQQVQTLNDEARFQEKRLLTMCE